MGTLILHKGDCLQVMKDISANSVDLIICDLPYGCLTGGGKLDKLKGASYGQGACAWDIKINLEKFWEQAKRILKDDHSPVIHFCTTKFGAELINSNPDWFRYDLVWDKQRGVSFLSANKMPMRSHEMIYVFAKKGAYYNRIDEDIGKKRCVLSVIKGMSSKQKKDNHPTEKPADLYRWLIERYCPPGGTVLDPTFGSGNSVFTAFEMGRNAIGIEKDDKFYDKAEKKLNTIE
jgi:site-specific DNA-methyltransferase (adenine-specific)